MTDTSPSPRYFFEFHVFVCCNRRPDGHPRGSCAAKHSERLRDYMKARSKELGIPKARINSAGCLDRCELGPCIVVYPQGDWLSVRTPGDVDRVLSAYQTGAPFPDDLMMPAAP